MKKECGRFTTLPGIRHTEYFQRVQNPAYATKYPISPAELHDTPDARHARLGTQ